jgi:Family of unknown function (DUF6353)
MGLSDIRRKAETMLSQNSTVILTSVGVSGTIATAVLTGKATLKCSHILTAESKILNANAHSMEEVVDFTREEVVRMCWKEYIPAVGVGTVTVSCIILANRLDSRKATALAAAYGISEHAFQEYKEKVVEKLGSGKEQKVRDEVAQDKVARTPVTKEVIITDGGEVLCFDLMTGRYFKSTVENIKQAANTVNEYILNHMYASLSQFYDELDIATVGFSDEVGWRSDGLVEIQFSTVLSPDQRPCVAVDFVNPPIADYATLY